MLWCHSIVSQHVIEPKGSIPNSQRSPPVPILSQTNPVHITPSHPPRFILILFTHLHRLGLPSGSFPLAFPPITYTRSSSPPFMLHDPPISSSSTWLFWLYLAKSTNHKVLCYAISPFSHHLIPLRSKYLPQHPVLKHPQSMFLP
jgi:hypothetical protein